LIVDGGSFIVQKDNDTKMLVQLNPSLKDAALQSYF